MSTFAHKHPFMLSVVVLLAVVLPGMVRIEQLTNNLDDQAEQVQAQADAIQAQADRNSRIATCLTNYATELTDALLDRDTVNKIGRAASAELWGKIRSWTQHPGTGRTEDLVDAIKRYEDVLDRISRTAAINPYPDVSACLTAADPGSVTFKLVAYHEPGHKLYGRREESAGRGWDDFCLGRRVTIRGTRGDDVIHGTDGPDVIFAYGGDDLALSGKGRDRICARWGDDTINAGKGFDRVACGHGYDFALQAERTVGCE